MKKILLAYDGGEPAKRALEQTIELATRFDAEVGVISVVPARTGRARRPVGRPDRPRRGAPRGPQGPARGRHRGRAARARRRLARTIERIADERGYDTIVIGTRGLGSLAKALQGSVSEHVASHAHTTVVVAR